ncbi:MAG: hypothetical protein R3301_18280 [Saprospiraceae bacterium]|nr:hypothetical protein [Saprospiraceae bacterium]
MKDSSTIAARIIDRYRLHGPVSVLADQLPRSELTSLFMHVFNRRAAKVPPAQLMAQLHVDRFVAPSTVPQAVFAWCDHRAFGLLPDWESIELAPIAPLGSCSVLAPVDQGLIVGTTRGQEVMSDCTNMLALLAAQRRRASRHGTLRLCTSHRLTRATPLADPRHTAHFRVFTLVTAGRDSGHMGFEIAALAEHFRFYQQFLNTICGERQIRLQAVVMEYAEMPADWSSTLSERARFPLAVKRTERPGWSYYHPFQFKINVTIGPTSLDLIDGGMVNWTQTLLSDRKERLLISAIGTEMLCKVLLEQDPGHFDTPRVTRDG